MHMHRGWGLDSTFKT